MVEKGNRMVLGGSAVVLSLVVLTMVALAWPSGAYAAGEDNGARARQFVAGHEAMVRPLEIEVGRQWWAASTSGKDEDFRKKQEAETRLDLQLADQAVFAQLKEIHQQPIRDRLLARQIEVLYRQYLARQVEPDLLKAINAKSNEVEQAFNVHRAVVGDKKLTENEVRDVLRHSTDSAQRRAVWEASKGVGQVVAADLKELVKLRNQAAHKLGFKNYHAMQLYLGEQSQEQVLALFDELDALTRGPFHAAKAEIDAQLARRCGIAVNELRPWHYHDPFFQESPAVFGGSLDEVYTPVDILRVCRDFYAGIGLPVDDILQRSDLYEKPGKSPHAFCTDIDREGDVRVLTNIVPGREWLSTMLHELGHAVYSKNIPRSVPYTLRGSSHALTTEGVAMMYERFTGRAEWLVAMGVRVPDAEQFNRTTAKLRRNGLLVFSRWCQVMFRFEMALYDNPEQDLNRLWWELVEEYQEVRRPEGRNAPDYASKIHLVSAPVYYHNYLMGELFATQLHRAIATRFVPGQDPASAVYVGNRAVGEFMSERVFAPGATMTWDELTRHATGEPLSAKAFAAELERN
jgi:peptidyl-dipeptidase A